MTELSATIVELIYENNKDSVIQNSKPVYEEHQQYKLKITLEILQDPPGDVHFCYCRHVYFHCFCIFVNTHD